MTGAPTRDLRCWRYGRDDCRQPATHSVRIGSSVYHYCDNPDHDPERFRHGAPSTFGVPRPRLVK